MTDDTFLDEMDLPMANHNEELETISENALRPLFDATRFQFCTQDRRDKGIDLTYELKKSGKHIGFRFIIQLKATESISPNKSDGSFSLQLDTSNINYLLNQSAPAFYVLYDANSKSFFYESMTDILKFLNEKDSNWGKQKSHVVRFNTLLASNGYEIIYKIAYDYGVMQRTLKERATYISATINSKDRITLDADFNITDDAKIREMIEVLGFDLINKGEWRKILLMHKKASGNIATSALYNLILGIVNYYGGSRWDAISFLKAASIAQTELNDGLIRHLKYFDATVKYAVGLISEEVYNDKVKNLGKNDPLRLFIQLENAKKKYMKSFENPLGEDFTRYLSEVDVIINDPDANDNVVLTAKCELILFEGYKNNTNFLSGMAEINAADQSGEPNVQDRVRAAKDFITANIDWSSKVEAIIAQSTKDNNHFCYFTALINYVKVSYQFDVFTKYVYVVRDLLGHTKQQQPDKKEFYELMQQRIGLAANYFSGIGHIENTVVATSAFYELLHYLGDFENAKKVMEGLETLTNNYDLEEFREKINLLKNGGTTHENFKKMIDSAVGVSEEEFTAMRAEMMAMDDAERRMQDRPNSKTLNINLHPIGYFQFPENERTKVYEILCVSENARVQFDQRFTEGVPIANLQLNPMTEEGPRNADMSKITADQWKNIHRVRKLFFENKYYRNERIR